MITRRHGPFGTLLISRTDRGRYSQVTSSLRDIRHLPLYLTAEGSDFTGEIRETVPECAVMLDGNTQFLGSRVFVIPGSQQ